MRRVHDRAQRERPRLVERREICERREPRDDRVVEPRRGVVLGAAVDDAMPDGVERRERVERAADVGVVDAAARELQIDRSGNGVVRLEPPQLQAARAGVDDQEACAAQVQFRISSESSPCSRV
jgi:hypothetical protein